MFIKLSIFYNFIHDYMFIIYIYIYVYVDKKILAEMKPSLFIYLNLKYEQQKSENAFIILIQMTCMFLKSKSKYILNRIP